MILEALIALTTALAPALVPAGLAQAGAAATRPATPPARPPAPPEAPVFSPTARAVSNWRGEAGAALLPVSLALVVRYGAGEPGFVARCVRLNNYWCIKRAGWSGELGGDGEGHTAFATAADGADAAALLLRRYYREFGRRSALAIVRRWAPAECGGPPLAALPTPRLPAAARGIAKTPAVSSDLAPRGIANTLRARYLARRAPGARARGPAVRVTVPRTDTALRVQPWSARARLAGRPGRRPAAFRLAAPKFPLPAVRLPLPKATLEAVPDIAAGLAADPGALLASDRLVAQAAALPPLTAGASGFPSAGLACGGDEPRIRNYAARIADSLGLKPDDDLGLFEADGGPSPRLAPVMLAMSNVELGAMRAGPALVAAAIARLSRRPEAAPASADDTAAGRVR